jgi:predicted small lipoprotein YifL
MPLTAIAGLDPAIHATHHPTTSPGRAVDARVKPGHDNQKLFAIACRPSRTVRQDSIGRGADRRGCLALILCGALAACGKKGTLKLPPADQAPAGQPPPAPPAEPEEEDEQILRDGE